MTVEEVEQLCRFYMNCQLSVAEEIELEYMLLQISIDSPLISETRELMNASRKICLEQLNRPKKRFIGRWWIMSVACAITCIVGIFFLWHSSWETDCIVYFEGKRVHGSNAKNIAMADVEKMEQFKQTVAAKMASENNKIEHFYKTIKQ